MMAQFLFGLGAGIIVGLVMEWVIDWAGLIPKRANPGQAAQKRSQNRAVASVANNGGEPAIPNEVESSSSTIGVGEE